MRPDIFKGESPEREKLMKKHFKRAAAALFAGILAAGLLAGCGGGGSAASTDSGSGDGTAITVFNSKMEIQEQLEEKAAEYSEEKGVDVEVYYSSDTVAAHLATRYSSDEPYTLSMVDAKDVYALAEEHALDLSDQEWVGNTTQAISVGGKVYGFPVCVEARGIIYNADAIKNATGEDFDPESIKTTDDFKAIIEKCKAGGMESPVGVMKEDWSLAAHFFAEIYEQQADPDAFIAGIKDGSIKLADDKKYNDMMDTFDVLRDNNYAKDAAISAEREVTDGTGPLSMHMTTLRTWACCLFPTTAATAPTPSLSAAAPSISSSTAPRIPLLNSSRLQRISSTGLQTIPKARHSSLKTAHWFLLTPTILWKFPIP